MAGDERDPWEEGAISDAELRKRAAAYFKLADVSDDYFALLKRDETERRILLAPRFT